MQNHLTIYEVNITGEAALSKEFLVWLKSHIKDMETIKGFQPNTEVLKENERDSISVRYKLDSIESLNHYLQNHAERMRNDLPETFKSELQFTRRILSIYIL